MPSSLHRSDHSAVCLSLDFRLVTWVQSRCQTRQERSPRLVDSISRHEWCHAGLTDDEQLR